MFRSSNLLFKLSFDVPSRTVRGSVSKHKHVQIWPSRHKVKTHRAFSPSKTFRSVVRLVKIIRVIYCQAYCSINMQKPPKVNSKSSLTRCINKLNASKVGRWSASAFCTKWAWLYFKPFTNEECQTHGNIFCEKRAYNFSQSAHHHTTGQV